MPKLVLLNNRLRVNKCGGVLIETPDDEDCCCACETDPGDGATVCYSISDIANCPNGLYLSGTFYGGVGGAGGKNPPSSSGWEKCVERKYTLKGYVKTGSGFDDFGTVEGIPLDNHIPCFGGPAGKTTILTQDSAEFDLEWLPDPTDENRFFIPIAYSATSSNCGCPTGINATVCVKFTAKTSE